MELQLNKQFLGLDGKPMEGQTVGQFLAQALASASKGDSLKYWGWATKLYAGEALTLDASDAETMKSFVRENEGLTALAKAQILEELK